MKKIEEAARKSGKFIAQELDNYEKGFEAGARYVLNAMTSESAVEIMREHASQLGGIKGGLSAVRKEIAGE